MLSDSSYLTVGIILLPKNSFYWANKIRNYFIKKHKIKKLGVIITDSRSIPLRKGITGVSLAYSGFSGLKDYRKSLDIFGRSFKSSIVNVVDSLAVSAVLCMGEGDERKPLAIITNAPVEYRDRIKKDELKIDIEDDIYGPIFKVNTRKVKR